MKKSLKPVRYKILSIDPYLEPYYTDIALRMKRNLDMRHALLEKNETLSAFANGYLYFGFNRTKEGWIYREWLPGADEVHLIGDFNQWDHTSHPLHRIDGGVWEITLDGADTLRHGQFIKILVRRGSEVFERIPAYIHCVAMDPSTKTLCGRIWSPPVPFKWTDGGYRKHRLQNPVIYEAHIGMSGEEERVHTYREFADDQLYRISSLGYNTIQLMGIQAHPYYASFGYQVTGYFAASSRYGSAEDLKYLINKAHALGIAVFMDISHNHACANVGEGLNRMDGTDNQYFLTGDRGKHPIYNTCLFDYARHEVVHFLLSSLKYWQEEYHIDGFRFSGVTSMIYHNHGLNTEFKSYDQYFSMNSNVEAITYLQLANELIHDVNPFAITIAEDNSGMPGMCIPVRSGGFGFDYHFTMNLPDLWIRLLRDTRDEDWNMYNLWYELTRRRPQEKNIGYCECHDQSLVGSQTFIFRMAGKEMYTGMEKSYHSPVIDRAIDLHKIMRFATLILASDGYLNFEGNEFGHPEWVDFPREGNNWSYKYARRQWSLAENSDLKYCWLERFDHDMLHFVRKYRVLTKPAALNLWIDQPRKLLAFSRGDMLYLFNFSTNESITNFFMPATTTGAGDYRVIFTSDLSDYGGHDRVSMDYIYHTVPDNKVGCGFEFYIPCRTAVVLTRIN